MVRIIRPLYRLPVDIAVYDIVDEISIGVVYDNLITFLNDRQSRHRKHYMMDD